MKIQTNVFSKLLMLSCMLLVMACTEEENGVNRQAQVASINNFINSLTYDADALLNVQQTDGAPSKREFLSEEVISTPGKGVILSVLPRCTA